jgi:hypothetical protein
MEEMHRTHKEPVWGWVAVVAGMVAMARRSRAATNAHARTGVRTAPSPRRTASVVTPWSPRSPSGWSA